MRWLILFLLLPYLYLLLRIYFHLLKIKAFRPGENPDIPVSVIVACRNEERNLPYLLEDLDAQNYNPQKLEIIIVDDNSTDSTFHSACAFRGSKNIRVIRSNGSGKKRAINTGTGICSGELIITTDADCRLSRNWVKSIASFYLQFRPDLITGPVKLTGEKGFFQRFQELEFLSLQGITAGTSLQGDPVMCNGANLAFTKEAYRKNSENLKYEKASGDDVFLLHSIKDSKAHSVLWLESYEAVARTAASATLLSFLRQRSRWISKSGSYRDTYTIILAISTFLAVIIQPLLIVAAISDLSFLLVFLAFLALKSVPDYLILKNVTGRYEMKHLMKWFIPVQLLYPYYVIAILPGAFHQGKNWK